MTIFLPQTVRPLTARTLLRLYWKDVSVGAILCKRSLSIQPLPNECLATDESRRGKIDERFQDTYEKLIEIRNHLDKLTMTQAWSLRETDLYMWQRKLDRIDDSRRNGNFYDAEGRPADLHTQRVCPLPMPEFLFDYSRPCCTSSEEATRISISF